MNELTREASKQTILEAISFLRLAKGRKHRKEPESRCEVFSEIVWLDKDSVRKLYEQPQKPLKHDFKRYCTEDIDVSSPCETLPPEYQNHLDRKYVKKSDGPLDVAAFRAYCEELDKDKEWIEKTEKELF